MFETSGDILNLTLSICAIVLTIFISWGIFYGIKIVKSIFEVIDQIQRTADRLEQLVVDTKEKVENSFSTMKITSEAVKGVIDYFANRKKEQKENSGLGNGEK